MVAGGGVRRGQDGSVVGERRGGRMVQEEVLEGGRMGQKKVLEGGAGW